MKKRLPVLLLCALMLLSACGKKQAEPVGSGSAEDTLEAQTKQDAKKTGKNTKKNNPRSHLPKQAGTKKRKTPVQHETLPENQTKQPRPHTRTSRGTTRRKFTISRRKRV